MSDDELNRSLCAVDSDELDGDMNLSDNEGHAEVFRKELKNKKKGQMRRTYQ